VCCCRRHHRLLHPNLQRRQQQQPGRDAGGEFSPAAADEPRSGAVFVESPIGAAPLGLIVLFMQWRIASSASEARGRGEGAVAGAPAR
jgi:hypothetical protein